MHQHGQRIASAQLCLSFKYVEYVRTSTTGGLVIGLSSLVILDVVGFVVAVASVEAVLFACCWLAISTEIAKIKNNGSSHKCCFFISREYKCHEQARYP